MPRAKRDARGATNLMAPRDCPDDETGLFLSFGLEVGHAGLPVELRFGLPFDRVAGQRSGVFRRDLVVVEFAGDREAQLAVLERAVFNRRLGVILPADI